MARLRLPALMLLALLMAGCAKIPLFSNVDEAEANGMMAALLRSGIPAEKRSGDEGSWTVQVGRSDFERSVKILTELGYPSRRFQGLGDSFKKSGLVSSPGEERIRFVHALSEEVSHTLSQLDGVVSARVHIVLPGNDPYGRDVKPSSAAVFLKHHPLVDLEDNIPAIKDLVTNSVEGLDAEKVSVVLVAAEPSELLLPVVEDSEVSASILGVSVPRTAAADVRNLVLVFAALVVLLLAALVVLVLKLRAAEAARGAAARAAKAA